MASYFVSDSIVKDLNTASLIIRELSKKIKNEVQVLNDIFEEYKNGLGRYPEYAMSSIEELFDLVEDFEKKATSLALSISKVSTIRKNHIENNPYKTLFMAVNGNGDVVQYSPIQDQRADVKRKKAIDDAWKKERELVLEGKGTRDWTVAQQAELIKYGKISGFEGQHMKNAAKYPNFASNPDNIQFLSYEEHFWGAHSGSFNNPTNGRFVPETGKMIAFKEDELIPLPIIELTNKYDSTQESFVSSLGRDFGYNRHEDIKSSRDFYKNEKSIHKAK